MRFRSTLLLLLILAGLGAYVVLVEVPKGDKEEAKDFVLTAKAGEVTELTLSFSDRKLLLRKTENDWRFVEPVDAPAENESVNGLISAVTTAVATKKLVDPGTDMAPFGLDKPFATVSMKVGEQQLPEVTVGKTTPVGGSVYVKRLDEAAVFLTAASLRFAVDKQVKDLRDKKLVTVGDDEVLWIEIQGRGKDIRLAKSAEGAWSMERPGPFKSDDEAIRTFIASVRALRAVDFISEDAKDPASFGLVEPRLQIRIGIAGGSEKSISFGDKKDASDVYTQVVGRPTVYTVADTSYRNIDKSARDLRDKTILAIDKTKVTSVVFERRDSPSHHLTKGENGHWAAENDAGPIKAAAVEQFLDDLQALKGYEIVGDNPSNLNELGLATPRLKLTVSGAEGPLGTVLVGETEGADKIKHFNTMVEGGSTVYLLRSYVFTRIDKSSEDFLDRPTPAASPSVGAGTAP